VARDEERKARSGEPPVIGGLPDFPGIVAGMRLSPGLAVQLRGLADEGMVDGLRAPTPPSADAYRARAAEIAEHGYSDPRVQSLPR
jgi:hypothetical protein